MLPLSRIAATGMLAGVLVQMAGCATPAPQAPMKPSSRPVTWEEASRIEQGAVEMSSDPAAAWWLALHDPTLKQLLSQARFASVEQALARVDEAQALLGQQRAGTRPQLSGGVQAQRGLEQNGVPQLVSRAGPSLQFGWEIDLWGRQSHPTQAAARRAVQREAESRLALLLAQTQVAELVHQERACRQQGALLAAEASSWTRTLTLQRERLRVGALSEQGMARIESQAAAQSAQLAQTLGQCRALRQALRALTGLTPDALDAALQKEPPTWERPPVLKPEQPAALLLQHPQMQAAAAAADAAQQDLAGARAAGLPSLNLSALLSHQWLRVMGQGSELNPWSMGMGLMGSLVDGGAGHARSEAAHARWRAALASLEQTLRQTVRDIETAVAQQDAAQRHWGATQRRAEAAARAWQASQSASDAGRLNGLDLEEAARQRSAADMALTLSQRDLTLAWIAVIKATGQAPLQLEPGSP